MVDPDLMAQAKLRAAQAEARRAALEQSTGSPAAAVDETDQEFAHLWPPGRQWAPTGTGG
jgi:hypothetical protein